MRLTTLISIALLVLTSACGKPDLLDQQAAALGKFPEGKTLALSGSIAERTYSGDFVWRAMRPGMVRVTLGLAPGQIYEEGYDGKGSWEKPIAHTKPHETTGAARDALKRGAVWLGNYRPLKELNKFGAKVEKLEAETLDGVLFDRIKVSFSNGDTTTFYLDPTSHLIARSRAVKALHPGTDDAPREMETVFENWQKIDKLMIAFKMTDRDVATGRVLQTTEWKQAAWEPGDKTIFAMPK
jgi:hypothetical protein